MLSRPVWAMLDLQINSNGPAASRLQADPLAGLPLAMGFWTHCELKDWRNYNEIDTTCFHWKLEAEKPHGHGSHGC